MSSLCLVYLSHFEVFEYFLGFVLGNFLEKSWLGLKNNCFFLFFFFKDLKILIYYFNLFNL